MYKLVNTKTGRELLKDVGESWNLSDQTIQQATRFVLKLYGSGMDTLNVERYVRPDHNLLIVFVSCVVCFEPIKMSQLQLHSKHVFFIFFPFSIAINCS